jgi:hypothetical protein
MKEEEWLEMLKERDLELYKQAKECVDKLMLALEEKQNIIERYQNLFASNHMFSGD